MHQLQPCQPQHTQSIITNQQHEGTIPKGSPIVRVTNIGEEQKDILILVRTHQPITQVPVNHTPTGNEHHQY